MGTIIIVAVICVVALIAIIAGSKKKEDWHDDRQPQSIFRTKKTNSINWGCRIR